MLIRQQASASALQKRRQSSANIKQEMHFDLAQTLMPIPAVGISDSKLSELVNTSIHNINTYGDNGSPCLIPLEGLITPDGSPLIRREHDTELCIP